MDQEEDLLLSRLAEGDKPSLYAAGIFASQALKVSGVAVLAVDALGRVHLLPPSAYELKQLPRLSDADLARFGESEAIQLLLKQGEDEPAIISYLRRRRDAERGA